MPNADYADQILLCSTTTAAAAAQWPTVLYYANRFTIGQQQQVTDNCR